MRLRILGNVKLKRDAICPYCKKVAGEAGIGVEILQNMDDMQQYASFQCKHCHERLMLPA